MVRLAFWLASHKVCADMRYINFVWVLLEAVAQNTRDVQERWPPQACRPDACVHGVAGAARLVQLSQLQV